MFINQDEDDASSMWLPVDDVPDPENSTADLMGVSIRDGVPTEKAHLETSSSEEMHHEVRDWKSLIPERISEVYTADLMNDWDLADDYDDALEEFYSPEEEQRGNVFMNYKWPQHYNGPHMKALESPLPGKLPEKPQNDDLVLEQTEKVVQMVKGDDVGKYRKLTFSQDSDGSSSISYEEEVRSPSVGEKVQTSKLEMEWRKVEEEGSSKKLEKSLMQSLLDLVR